MTAFDPTLLLDPASYPHAPQSVTLVETHISWVFLAGDRVFKIKKPVNFGFLDYSSLQERKRLCDEEVRLNRRLCPDAYLGVEKIVAMPSGLQVGGSGPAIEYAVVMQRLPADRMLDHLIQAGEVTESMIERVAERIAAFHDSAERGLSIDRHGSPAAVRANWAENFEQIAPFVGRTVSAAHVRTIQEYVEHFLNEQSPLFEQRVAEGFIREGHGDMRAESICVTNGMCIFDCIEFSERLRCGDTASEMAFLAMDIDARGRPDLAYWLIDRYVSLTGDTGLAEVLLFYACYRAFVRGKVQSFRLDQDVARESAHRTARRRARHYLQLAWWYARGEHAPRLVLVGGLSGTGKTTLARALGLRLGAAVISSDRVRKELGGVATTHRTRDAQNEGLYTEEMTRKTYARMNELAKEALRLGRRVVLDATFRTREERCAAIDLAHSAGLPWWIVECRLAEEIAVARIEQRLASGEGASDANVSIYRAQRSTFEPVEADEGPLAIVDTGGPVSATLRRALGPMVRGLKSTAGRPK
ncbi:MAG: AAA family ATPase [Chloroflexota bacterium]